ncbi:MAG TPA: TIR domain-containing protein [Roseiarcus sp.]|nr:TIR domain-containing protein [Roseiarcus sp.]
MGEVKIFVSHNSKYADLAKGVKLSLEALESENSLDVRISEEMAGATDWRKWIEDNVRSSDIFLLLFPSADMDMTWCNYELGRFYGEDRKIVCIKNTDIKSPPPTFEPYQAYSGDEDGIRKFIDELFVSGNLTNGKPLNPRIGKFTDKLYERAQDVSREMAQKFAQARVRDLRYERRIVLSIRYDDAKRFDPEASTVQGNVEGLNVLGLGQATPIKWSTIRMSTHDSIDWPSELEAALPSITVGSLPPALPPFFSGSDIYLPVITKAQSVDGLLEEVVLIFVTMNKELVRPLVDWSMPSNMPDSFVSLVRLVRLMFRARWEILEPRYQEAKYRLPSPDRCAEIVRSVVADYDRMRHYAESQGIVGLDKFYAVFQADLRTDIEACGDEWMDLMTKLGATPPQNSADLAARLRALLANNAKWLQHSAKQFAVATSQLG